MEGSFANISREILEKFINPEAAQAISSLYSQYIPQPANSGLGHAMSQIAGQNVPLDCGSSAIPSGDQSGFSSVVIPEATHISINITRRAILTLTSVLERIPQEYVLSEETGVEQPLTLTIVNDIETAPLVTTSSQKEMRQHVSSDLYPDEPQGGHSIVKGKRRRPEYSLTRAMLKKQPFL